MSATEIEPPAAPVELAQGEAACCTQCGTPLRDDQEWCLECGAARTLIHRPPDWRIPAVTVGAIVLLVLTGLAIVLIGLSDSANREAATSGSPPRTPSARAGSSKAAAPSPTSPSTSSATTSPTGAAATTTASAPGLASWPIGLSGWTVVLATAPTEAAAQADAARLRSYGATGLGLIETSQHPAMRGPPWAIFSGRYPTGQLAASAAGAFRSRGLTRARAELVGQSGG